MTWINLNLWYSIEMWMLSSSNPISLNLLRSSKKGALLIQSILDRLYTIGVIYVV
jgi:hypothetical protein